MGYSPWCRKESDLTEQLSIHTQTHAVIIHCVASASCLTSLKLKFPLCRMEMILSYFSGLLKVSKERCDSVLKSMKSYKLE